MLPCPTRSTGCRHAEPLCIHLFLRFPLTVASLNLCHEKSLACSGCSHRVSFRQAVRILVPIIQQLCMRLEVPTPTQLETVMRDPGWKDNHWPNTSEHAKVHKAGANAAWRLLGDCAMTYLIDYAPTPPGADPPAQRTTKDDHPPNAGFRYCSS